MPAYCHTSNSVRSSIDRYFKLRLAMHSALWTIRPPKPWAIITKGINLVSLLSLLPPVLFAWYRSLFFQMVSSKLTAASSKLGDLSSPNVASTSYSKVIFARISRIRWESKSCKCLAFSGFDEGWFWPSMPWITTMLRPLASSLVQRTS